MTLVSRTVKGLTLFPKKKLKIWPHTSEELKIGSSSLGELKVFFAEKLNFLPSSHRSLKVLPSSSEVLKVWSFFPEVLKVLPASPKELKIWPYSPAVLKVWSTSSEVLKALPSSPVELMFWSPSSEELKIWPSGLALFSRKVEEGLPKLFYRTAKDLPLFFKGIVIILPKNNLKCDLL